MVKLPILLLWSVSRHGDRSRVMHFFPLAVRRDAGELRKCYLRLALKHQPDKAWELMISQWVWNKPLLVDEIKKNVGDTKPNIDI